MTTKCITEECPQIMGECEGVVLWGDVWVCAKCVDDTTNVGKPIEETNDDCSVCGIILTDDDMDSETGKCEMCNEEVEEAWCIGCGKKEIWDDAENSDMCKTCELKKRDVEYEKSCEEMRKNGYERDEFSEWKKEEEVEPVKKCEECDKILGWHNGEHEMTVEWFGKTTCGNCALVKAKYKLTE